jgi:DNA polymerase I-like protein with 3'-5' exonuclease and polymerase domains
MKPSLEELFWRSEMPLVDILTQMEHVGVNCDVNTAMRMELKCNKLLQAYDDYWDSKVLKPLGVSWSSNKQLIALFKAQGMPVQYKLRIKKDKSRVRTECIDEDVLELYRDGYKSQLALHAEA